MPTREQALSKLFELKEKLGGINGLDLLWKLLDINPATRISAEKALQHEFFNSIKEPQFLIHNSHLLDKLDLSI